MSPSPVREWVQLHRYIFNAVHGQSMKIILDEDPDYYYEGRVYVESWKSEMEDKMEFPQISATVGPFKWENDLAEYSSSFSSSDITSERILVTVGTDVSSQSWNTDLRFGTPEIPTFDFSLYAGIYLEYTYSKNSSYRIQIVDGDKNYAYFDMGSDGCISISTEEIENAGVDPSKIYRILLSGAPEATLYVDTYSSVTMTVEGGKWNTVPEIYILSSIDSVTLNGESFEVNAGYNRNEDMKIRQGENTLVFSGNFDSTTIQISYRRGWL